MRFLAQIQKMLEENYGAHTGLNVLDYVHMGSKIPELGKLLVEHDPKGEDLNVALLFDRDILAAWQPESTGTHSLRNLSVPLEEVSHFVYLSFNHNRGRNITTLEMEIQSEVDRILVAFHGPFDVPHDLQQKMLFELMERPYDQENYEVARKTAAAFVRLLCGAQPEAWSEEEFTQLRKFFHSDLSQKINIAKGVLRS